MCMYLFLPGLPSLQCSCKDITMANGYCPCSLCYPLLYREVKVGITMAYGNYPLLPVLPSLQCNCSDITMANGYYPLLPGLPSLQCNC